MMKGAVQVVVFEVRGDPFALPVSAVRSVVRGGSRRALPGGVPWVVGVADVRGRLLPLVDLGLRLGREARGVDGDLVVVEVGEEGVVVPVDRVVGLETLEGVAPAPPGASEATAGIAFAGDRLVVMLDPSALLPGGGRRGASELMWDGDPAALRGRSGVEVARVVAREVDDVSALHELRGLRELDLRARGRTPVDLRAFPRLERVALRWRPGSVLESATLRSLELTHYTGKDLRGLAGLPALRALTLEYGPLRRLDGVEALPRLEELRLRRLRRLAALDGAEGVARVEVENCPRLSGAR